MHCDIFALVGQAPFMATSSLRTYLFKDMLWAKRANVIHFGLSWLVTTPVIPLGGTFNGRTVIYRFDMTGDGSSVLMAAGI